MKKTIILFALIATVTLSAQTSRLSVHLGGGTSTNFCTGGMKNLYYPMGSMDIGYSFISADDGGTRFGLRTGINLVYSQVGFRADISDKFTNYDYEKRQMDYTVRGRIDYSRKQMLFGMPLMLVVTKGGFVCNMGVKFMMPLWNQYKQEVTDVDIYAYYPSYGVTVRNDLATGLIPDDRKSVSGTASLPTMTLAISAEIGYMWDLSWGSNIGFDFFIDYSPWGFGGKSVEGGKSPIVVGPIVNDQVQPIAPVTVNLLSECGGEKWNYLNFGVRLVYAFDFE